MDIFYATFGAGMAAVLYGLLRLERENRAREQSIRELLDELASECTSAPASNVIDLDTHRRVKRGKA